MRRAPTVRQGWARRRPGSWAVSAAVALPFTAVLLGAAPAARAEDLPGELVAAAKLIPATDQGLRVCFPISGLENVREVHSIVDPPPDGSDPGRIYTTASRGAYLGDGRPGVPAPPFAQALIDTGAVERLEVRWRERRIGFPAGVTVLRDNGGTAGAPAPTVAPERPGDGVLGPSGGDARDPAAPPIAAGPPYEVIDAGAHACLRDGPARGPRVTVRGYDAPAGRWGRSERNWINGLTAVRTGSRSPRQSSEFDMP